MVSGYQTTCFCCNRSVNISVLPKAICMGQTRFFPLHLFMFAVYIYIFHMSPCWICQICCADTGACGWCSENLADFESYAYKKLQFN